MLNVIWNVDDGCTKYSQRWITLTKILIIVWVFNLEKKETSNFGLTTNLDLISDPWLIEVEYICGSILVKIDMTSWMSLILELPNYFNYDGA